MAAQLSTPRRSGAVHPTRVRRPQRLVLAPSPVVWWLCTVAALPVVVAAARAIAAHWVPEGDDGIIAARIRSVFSSHPPIMGMRSTSGYFDSALSTHHPGPLEFYLDAPIAGLFGFSAAGIVLAVAVFNIVCVVAAVVVAHRMRGLRTSLPVVGAILLSEWMLGPDVLARPFNPYAGTLAVLLMVVSAWATVDRDPHGLWLTALSGSFAAQSNLAFCPLVIGVVGTACVSVAYRAWRRTRTWQPSDRSASHSVRRHRRLLTGGAIALAWLPSIIELFAIHPNNAELMARYASGSDETSANPSQAAGLADGFRFVLGHLSPSRIGRVDTHFTDIPTTTATVIGVGVVVLLIAGATAGRRLPHTAASRGCWVLLVATVAESLAVSRTPATIAATYWLLPVLVLAPMAYAILLIRVTEILRASGRAIRVPAAVRSRMAAGALAAVIGTTLAVVASATAAAPPRTDSDRTRAVGTEVVKYLRANARPGAPVRINASGAKSYLSVAPGVGFMLMGNDHHAYFLGSWPYREDSGIRSWYVTNAPSDPITVTFADADSVADAHPGIDAQPVQAQGAGSDVRIWIAIPPERHR